MQPDPRVQQAVERLSATEPGTASGIAANEVFEAAISHIAELATKQHPLGFMHVDMTPLAALPGAALRLHLWSKRTLEAADVLGNMHDHIWSLKSVVLVGAITDVQLEPVPTKGGPFTLAQVTYGEVEDRVDALPGRFDVRERMRTSVTTDRVYALP